jgi:hypothetical protein
VHFGVKAVPLQSKKQEMAIDQALFRRSELLLGNEAMERIAQKRQVKNFNPL